MDLYLYSEESEKSQNISREYLHLNDLKFRMGLRKFSLFLFLMTAFYIFHTDIVDI